MRKVTLTLLGSPTCEGAEVTIEYNGPMFEFLAPEWRALARRAAAAEGGMVRDDNRVAKITE